MSCPRCLAERALAELECRQHRPDPVAPWAEVAAVAKGALRTIAESSAELCARHALDEAAQREIERKQACRHCHGAGAWTLDHGHVPCPWCQATWRPGAGVPIDLTARPGEPRT